MQMPRIALMSVALLLACMRAQAAPQNYRKDPTIYGDSSRFHFFVGTAPGGHRS